MTAKRNPPKPGCPSGPGITLLSPLAAVAVMFAFGCGAATGECVATYEFEGEVRKSNYTRAECEEECSIIGRTLSCYFEGRSQSPLAATERYEFQRARR